MVMRECVREVPPLAKRERGEREREGADDKLRSAAEHVRTISEGLLQDVVPELLLAPALQQKGSGRGCSFTRGKVGEGGEALQGTEQQGTAAGSSAALDEKKGEDRVYLDTDSPDEQPGVVLGVGVLRGDSAGPKGTATCNAALQEDMPEGPPGCGSRKVRENLRLEDARVPELLVFSPSGPDRPLQSERRGPLVC